MAATKPNRSSQVMARRWEIALRRILLRSLEGVAISRVRIDSVWHEFSTVEDVREDVTELVLNFKKVRLRRAMEVNGDVRGHSMRGAVLVKRW